MLGNREGNTEKYFGIQDDQFLWEDDIAIRKSKYSKQEKSKFSMQRNNILIICILRL